jgi:hypothetical protein
MKEKYEIFLEVKKQYHDYCLENNKEHVQDFFLFKLAELEYKLQEIENKKCDKVF